MRLYEIVTCTGYLEDNSYNGEIIREYAITRDIIPLYKMNEFWERFWEDEVSGGLYGESEPKFIRKGEELPSTINSIVDCGRISKLGLFVYKLFGDSPRDMTNEY